MLFIAGHHGSGKTTAAEHLRVSYKYLHSERSQVLSGLRDDDQPGLPMRAWRTEMTDRFGAFALEDMIQRDIGRRYEEMMAVGREPAGLVITGNRSLDEIRYLSDALHGMYRTQPKIVAIQSDEQTLFRRYVTRSRSHGDTVPTEGSFRRQLDREREAGIGRIFEAADFLIRNDGSPLDLLEKIDAVVREHDPTAG